MFITNKQDQNVYLYTKYYGLPPVMDLSIDTLNHKLILKTDALRPNNNYGMYTINIKPIYPVQLTSLCLIYALTYEPKKCRLIDKHTYRNNEYTYERN